MRRGRIWRVCLDPTVGDEMRKTRPAVIVSADQVGIQRLRIVVPLTGWQTRFADWPWMVRIEPHAYTGLAKPSAADALQLKSLSTDRFVTELGHVSDDDVARILCAIDVVLGKV